MNIPQGDTGSQGYAELHLLHIALSHLVVCAMCRTQLEAQSALSIPLCQRQSPAPRLLST